MQATLVQDRELPGVFRVETIDADGGVDVAIFSGPNALERARSFERCEETEARCAMLQKKLWSVLKDHRDKTSCEALTAAQDLEWAIAQRLNSHLPTIDEVIAAGPYVRVGWNETLEQARARAATELQKSAEK